MHFWWTLLIRNLQQIYRSTIRRRVLKSASFNASCWGWILHIVVWRTFIFYSSKWVIIVVIASGDTACACENDWPSLSARDVYFVANENSTGVIKTLIVEMIIATLTFTRCSRQPAASERDAARGRGRYGRIRCVKERWLLHREIDAGFSKTITAARCASRCRVGCFVFVEASKMNDERINRRGRGGDWGPAECRGSKTVSVAFASM